MGTYHLDGKNGNFGWKIKCYGAIAFGKLRKNWAVIWVDANFLLFLVCSADLDVLCSGPFSHDVKFYSFIFKHTISTQVICVNDKHLYNYYQNECCRLCNLVAGHIIRKTNVSILFPRCCRMISGSRGVGVLGLIFARYVPLASQSPYPIIVYSVANYRPHLSHI